MSFSQQLGYTSYAISGSPMTSAQLLSPPSSSTSPTPSMSGACCENGRSLINPHTGQTVCSCQYPPGLLTYSRMGLPDPVYSNPAYSTTQGYMSLGGDPSAFYPPLNSPYDLKEGSEPWRGISQHQSCYPYDPSSMHPYPYSNAYGGMDINSAARRKNATRENTNTLKAWLYEHRKNPYPTKGEKIMLAIITKMTLTQVSTWFANARRRLKKENKMTWSPRNKPGGNDDDDGDDDDEDDDDTKDKSDKTEIEEEKTRGKSPTNEKKSCDREGQLSNDVTEGSSPCSSMRTVRMYDTSSDSTHMSRSRLPSMNDHNLRRCQGNFPPPHMSSEASPSFLNLQPLPRGYNEGVIGCVTSPNGSVASAIDTNSAALNKRPDSLCSNSNDSGLSDGNCSYADSTMEGLRPKIWSLAHVATSDARCTNLNNNSAMGNDNGGNINCLPRNMSSSSHGPCMNVVPGGGPSSLPLGLVNTGFNPGHNRHDGIQSSSSSASSSLSSFTPSPSMPSLPSSMPHWGPMYGPPSLGGSTMKHSCQGTLASQSLPGMMPGGLMVSPSLNSMPGAHNSSTSFCYNKGMMPSSGYYPNSKMGLE